MEKSHIFSLTNGSNHSDTDNRRKGMTENNIGRTVVQGIYKEPQTCPRMVREIFLKATYFQRESD